MRHLTFARHSVLAPESLLIYHCVKMKVKTLGFSGTLLLVGMQNSITLSEDILSVSNLHVYSPLHQQ